MRWNHTRQAFSFVLMAILLPPIAVSCSRETTSDGKEATDRFHRGYAHMNKKEYDQAMAYVHRAVAFFQKGEVDRAIADNTEAIRLDPKSAVAYRNRGREYLRKN